MRILALESSCDETGAAIVEDGRHILANVVASQADLHARYGGVVPEVAARQQVSALVPVVEQALERAGLDWPAIDAIAATYGPGLAGPLLIGLTAGKTLAYARGLPFVGVNHLEAHIYANWLRAGTTAEAEEPRFPVLALVISGAHTELVVIRDHGQYELLGQTRDDAAGEAFDKVARLLGLGYPGGPAIERAAATLPTEATRYVLPRAWIPGTHDFSFSGVKTAVAQRVRAAMTPKDVPAMAAAFQEAVVDVLATKTTRAAEALAVRSVLLAGGVAANLALRARLERQLGTLGVALRYPPVALCTDNAAMIAAAAYYHLRLGERHDLDLDVRPNLTLPFARTA